jgi:hypothetical protein
VSSDGTGGCTGSSGYSGRDVCKNSCGKIIRSVIFRTDDDPAT